MKNIKLIFVFITILFISSCSRNENFVELKIQELKFTKSSDLKSTKESDFLIYIVKINQTGKLFVDENYLTLSEAVNKETGEKSFVITEKEKQSTTLKSLQLPAKSESEMIHESIKSGYWFDGYDCFIYGTIITDDDGDQLFIPADLATQYLMNSCGWRYLA
ncbi:MAG: hypothetical protein HC831_30755 [Chloroflexia bacterium]|nr:hypothetical protein [Bacteroidales bacterium]NJO92862.1 hypothetical protein [Chloroflexia bacterium]